MPAISPSEILPYTQQNGLVGIVSIPVPGSDGEGAPVDVSAYKGPKTFELSGNYTGVYTILGSHDGINYGPLLIFNAGQFGQQGLAPTVPFVVKWVKVRRRASATVTVNMAAALVCTC
jgi:hypothetical protein